MYVRLTCSAIALLSVSTLASSAALAQETSLDAVLSCRGIADNDARLACFDAAAGQLATDSESGDLVTVSRSEIEAVERDSFGFSLPSLPRFSMNFRGNGESESESDLTRSAGDTGTADGAVEIVERNSEGGISTVRVAVASVSSNNGDWLFTTENGQVWRETESRRINLPRNRDGMFLEIQTAAFGSYLAQINGQGRSFRVRREQ